MLTASEPEEVMRAVLEALPLEGDVKRVSWLATGRLRNGAAARLGAIHSSGCGVALVGATGPPAHAVLVLDSWNRIHNRPVDPPDEETFYSEADLPFIPPELRNDGSEFDLARAGKLPPLLERSALRGAVHAHTTWSDGSGTVAEMLDAAAAAGLSWVGISDHSPTASYAGGLTPERVALQPAEIEAEAAKRPSLAVFKGTECDILGAGELDYPDSVLDGFDFLVASVHSRFTMPKEEMTARVIRAIEDPHTTVLGHPTGRLLLGRDGYALDVPEVLRACAREGVVVKELGVVVSIGPDAHEPAGFGDLDHGVAVARRAALPPGQILNTRDAAGAREFFRSRRKPGRKGK